MKKRTKRDIGIFLGVIGLIGTVAFVNGQLSRGSLTTQFEDLRESIEERRITEDTNLLRWNHLRKTKGTLRKGGRFGESLYDYHQKHVNIVGFMVPQEQFRDVTEFLLLPIPLECYFCAMPPSRDVLLVQLAKGETAQIYMEPIVVNGIFEIHEGPGQKFFYSLEDARIGAAEDGGDLTKKRLKIQHMLPNHEPDPDLLLDPRRREDTD